MPSSFGSLLKGFRLRAGLSQNQLARRAEIDPAYVNRLENAPADSSAVPRRRVILALAGVMELGPVDTDRLLVAAGLCPQSVTRLGRWEPSLGLVAQVLADPNLTEDDRSEFRQFIRIAAGRWGAPG
jgi:transcriptional regulator with XRE-family HTH domain